MKFKEHNRSKKKHARLMHALFNLANPGVQIGNAAWNIKYRLKKWSHL